MRIWLLAALLTFTLSGCVDHTFPRCRGDDVNWDGEAGASAGMICVDGRQRDFIAVVPEGDGPFPLLVALHGGGGDAANMMDKTGLDQLGLLEGVVVLFPEGTPGLRGADLRTWNAVHCCGRAQEDGTDDVAFLDALIELAAGELPIDRERIGVTGHSNGGMMAHRYGAERSETVALIAPVAGSVGGATPPGSAWKLPLAPSSAIDVLIIHATDDPRVPYDGGQGENLGAQRHDASVQDAVDFWESHGSTVQVVATTGGHGWPGGQPDITPAPASPNASQLIVDRLRA